MRGPASSGLCSLSYRGWRRQDFASACRLLAALVLLCSFAGCAIQLSPAYDETTYESLVDLNVKAETLFASLSGYGTAGDFADYKPTYDELIGGFSAARMSAATRELPSTSRRLFATDTLKATCGDDPTNCVNPTPHHLAKVIVLLTAMRDTHQKGGLVRDLVSGSNGQGGFKRQYEIEMNPVLVFERSLKR